MSENVENVESLRKCTRCSHKITVEDWGIKPNGDYYKLCNACRVEALAKWNNRSKEYDEQKKLTRRRLVICPICGRELAHHCLLKHTKRKVCKASVPEI